MVEHEACQDVVGEGNIMEWLEAPEDRRLLAAFKRLKIDEELFKGFALGSALGGRWGPWGRNLPGAFWDRSSSGP